VRADAADAGRFQDPDIDLMLRFQRGDEAAFEQLVLKHQKGVLNVVYRYLGDRGAGEDAAQEVFLKVYRARASYQPQAKFTTWLYRITVNHCLNEVRSRRSKPEGPSLVDDLVEEGAATTPDAGMNRADLRRAVKEAVDSLPENQRVAVILARYEELSYEEIAEAMQVSLEAVKSLLFRAKENLKTRLAKYVGPDR
jgi:RNA polymerase sigma-70 factor (ECF subfamily)